MTAASIQANSEYDMISGRAGKIGVAAVAVLAGIVDANAQTADGHCLPAAFGDKLAAARVSKARGKVHFIRGVHEDKACPGPTDACRTRSFLMAGDVVLTSDTRGDLICATFVNAKAQETSGWLPAAALETLAPPATLAPSAWSGTWKRIEAEIQIKPALYGELVVQGTATWGGNDPQRVARGSVRTGDLTGKAKPAGDVLFLSDEPAPSFEKVPDNVCAARMQRVAQYLLVEDNKACGGMNVSFTGLYIRR